MKDLDGMRPRTKAGSICTDRWRNKGFFCETEVPKAFSYENTSTLELSGRQNNLEDTDLIFYAYGGGRYLGAFKISVKQ